MKLGNQKKLLSLLYLLLCLTMGVGLTGLLTAISEFYSSSNLLMLLLVGLYGWGLILIRNEFYALDRTKMKLRKNE